jgi:uncharacterized protein YjbI with pentapeptide repeats
MMASRRNFLARLIGAATAGGIAAPAIATSHARRISQGDLNGAIESHALWLADRSRGARAAFPDCDLSGLDFHGGQDALVDLRGSDFTNADLSGVTGNLVSFRRSSLHYARLSGSRLIEPGFIDASLRGAICEDVVWGRNDRLPAGPAHAGATFGAAMFNCDAGQANFRRARIRGHFCQTGFVAASLIDADFSYSAFSGSFSQQTSFFGADLTRARFDHAELAYTRFSQATLAGTDFRKARIGPRVKLPEELLRQIMTAQGAFR